MNENKTCVVYHIRRSSNPQQSEGYIGITMNDINYRLGEHKVRGNKHLMNAFNLYNDIIIEILLKGPLWLCKLHEYNLRPNEKMGWNLAIGGGKPPIINSDIGRIRGTKGYYKSKECSDSRKRGELTRKNSGFYNSEIWLNSKTKISEATKNTHKLRLETNYFESEEWKISLNKRTRTQLFNKAKKFNLIGLKLLRISKDGLNKTEFSDILEACDLTKSKFSCIYNYLNKGLRYGYYWKTAVSVTGEMTETIDESSTTSA
jgi:hypothetical protein